MNALGIGPRDVLALARHQRRARDVRGPLLVTGLLAEQLARELRAGGEPGLVRTSGEPAQAAAFVRVVAGAATAEDERTMREATRALVPVVAVQTAGRPIRLPYVLTEDVVECPPGSGFPVAEIADRLAAALGQDGAPLAAALPVLRDAVARRSVTDGALAAASLAAFGAETGPRLPVLALAQARMLSDLSVTSGPDTAGTGPETAARNVGVPLAAAIATGLAGRELVRRLPVRVRSLDALVAAGATLALGTAFRRIARS